MFYGHHHGLVNRYGISVLAKGYPEAVRRRRKSNAMIKRKRTNNDITQQTKEQATGTLHNTKVELW
jgi:hypothetical protein